MHSSGENDVDEQMMALEMLDDIFERGKRLFRVITRQAIHRLI